MRVRDLFGALFLYGAIAAGYGAWALTRDPRWHQLPTVFNAAFLEHCIAWPRLISSALRSAIVLPGGNPINAVKGL